MCAQEAQALRGGSFAQALSEWVDNGGSVGAQTAAAVTVRRFRIPDCGMIFSTALQLQGAMFIAFWRIYLLIVPVLWRREQLLRSMERRPKPGPPSATESMLHLP